MTENSSLQSFNNKLNLKFQTNAFDVSSCHRMFVYLPDIDKEIELYPKSYSKWETPIFTIPNKKIPELTFQTYLTTKDKIKLENELKERKINLSVLDENNLNICSFDFKSNLMTIQHLVLNKDEKTLVENCHRKLKLVFINEIKNFLVMEDSFSFVNTIENFFNKIPDDEFEEFNDEISENYEKEKNLSDILSIVFYRLRVLYKNKNCYDIENYMNAFQNVHRIYKINIISNINDDKYVKFFLCLLFNSTVGFVDPQTKSLESAIELLEEDSFKITPSCFYSVQKLIEIEKNGVIAKSINLLRDIYKSKKFTNGLKEFILKYGKDLDDLEKETSKATKYFEDHLYSIIFVEKAFFSGMCGLNGEIYIGISQDLHIGIFDPYNSLPVFTEILLAFIISTVLHQMSNSLLKHFMKNWTTFPSRCKLDIEKNGSAYDFQKILFKTIISNFSTARGITDINRWNQNYQILDEEDLQVQEFIHDQVNQRFTGISFSKKQHSS